MNCYVLVFFKLEKVLAISIRKNRIEKDKDKIAPDINEKFLAVSAVLLSRKNVQPIKTEI